MNVAGFKAAAYIQIANLWADLISALVERWHPEAHTFHHPCGEATTKLQDLVVQLGLSINGETVTRPGKVLVRGALANNY